MNKTEWILCPICRNKTRTKICPDTILENFPLFCPKCRQETLISIKQMDEAYHQKWFHVKAVLPFLPVFAVGGLAVAGIMVWI